MAMLEATRAGMATEQCLGVDLDKNSDRYPGFPVSSTSNDVSSVTVA